MISDKLTLDMVSLDVTGWRPDESGPTSRSWYADQACVQIRLMEEAAPESTLEGWRARAARETASKSGTCLSLTKESVDGCTAFRGVFKYPGATLLASPKLGLAVYIVGLISVPLRDHHLTINIEAFERGDTGAREVLYSLAKHPEPRPITAATRPRSITMEEYFERVRTTLGRELPSDSEDFDHAIPQHPLSQVRRLQRRVIGGLKLAPQLKQLAMPYHGAS